MSKIIRDTPLQKSQQVASTGARHLITYCSINALLAVQSLQRKRRKNKCNIFETHRNGSSAQPSMPKAGSAKKKKKKNQIDSKVNYLNHSWNYLAFRCKIKSWSQWDQNCSADKSRRNPYINNNQQVTIGNSRNKKKLWSNNYNMRLSSAIKLWL